MVGGRRCKKTCQNLAVVSAVKHAMLQLMHAQT